MKRHTPKQVINKLREAEVAMAKGVWYGDTRVIGTLAGSMTRPGGMPC